MTGFGVAEGRVGETRVSVELRSVNHRFFNPSIKLPAMFSRWEGDVRESLRRRFARGHITLYARALLEGDRAAPIDEGRFAAAVERLRALQKRHALGGELDLATVLRVPDLFVSADAELPPETLQELIVVVEQAAASLSAMRTEEGERLAGYILERLAVVEAAVGRIEARAPVRLVEQRERLRQAVRELADGLAVDEQRMVQEIAILADRLDVAEEMTRFRSHLAAFRDSVRRADGEPVGKRLGFLLQEMLREANTAGSKANDAAMLQEVVAVKEELERIREQVENLE